MKLKVLLPLLLLICTNVLISQNSSIKGKVIDEKTGETLPGATVVIQGTTTGGNTDLDGLFSINNLSPGTYTLECKLISYNTKIITDVIVKSEEPTILTITVETASTELGVVEVTATMSKETTGALLVMQKNSSSVSDGVSSESIKRTPDKSTSDVLKRVSGASIQDNKFAIIRGLNDRYNAAYINGAPLPSSEADRKAFAFDIFPSNMLDNLVIIKTATPELPAEFAGGIIQINTKNIPDKNFQSFSLGAGYNTITTGKTQVYYEGGKTDWLGLDDGSRAMPSAIPSENDFPVNIHEQAALAKQTEVDWKLYDKKFSPNYNFQYSMGYVVPVKKRPLGIILALTYNKGNNYNETVRRGYSGNDGASTIASQIDFDYLDKTYSEQVLAGGLANLSLKLNDNNSFSFKNLYSINSDDKVIARGGKTNPLEANPTLLKSNARWFTSNKIYSGQFTGEHYIPKAKIHFNWTGALSQIERKIPNLRRTIYTRLDHIDDPSSPNPYDTVYTANIATSNVGPDYGGGMFFSDNKEKIYSFKADASYGFGKDLKTELKIGGFIQSRSRVFAARQLGYTRYGLSGGSITFKDSLLYLDDNSIFNSENLGLITPAGGGMNGVGGFKLTEGTKPSDKYTASSTLQAAYIMLDNRYKFARIVWGARLENFNQKLNAKYSTLDSVSLDMTKLDILPSANLILSVTEKQNVRLSYSQTLNRPEYRELAPFAFYDFNTQFVISGDTTLRRAKIYNGDLRWEYYPGKGQLVSTSVFYKQFIDPIEQISRPDVTNEVSFRNVSKAYSYGLELEFRLLIATLFKSDSSKFLNNLTAFSNLAIIRSKVDVTNVIGSGSTNRPLQGQSPYVWNAGLQYLDTDLGMSFSASFNKVGPRIAIVGNINEPDLWENSRAFLDFQVTKNLWKNRIEIKLNAQNILAQEQIFYQNRDLENSSGGGAKGFFNSIITGDSENKQAYDKKEDDVLWSTKFGQTYSLSISVKF
ncbi:MAG: carboxypeptidase-like regulatory domain-containing protein [Bacteroidota bacterium]|nr:carboxypeptidase-like regulatory domain-containing protein [Bacteroidota bacterium]